MDAVRDYYARWSKSHSVPVSGKCDITYMLNLKYNTNEPIYKTETDIENKLVVAKVEGGGSGMDWGW